MTYNIWRRCPSGSLKSSALVRHPFVAKEFFETIKFIVDTGAGVDVVSGRVRLAVADVGAAVDSISRNVKLTIAETGTGVDSVSLYSGPPSELKHTVRPAGQGGDFTSLAAAVAHLRTEHSNLVAANVYATIEIGGSWSAADTAYERIYGITTDETHYVHIYTDGQNRASTFWDTSKYRLVPVNHSPIVIDINHCRVDGLQLSWTDADWHGRCGVYAGFYTWIAGRIDISNCLIRAANSATYNEHGLRLNIDSGGVVNVWNCVIYNINTISGSYGIWANGPVKVYSTTVVGGGAGIYRAATTLIAKNCYAGGQSGNSYLNNPTLTTCASSDQTGSPGLRGIPVSTATFVNVTPGSENWKLASGSALVNAGTDTSGDPAPFNFTTDIDGNERTGYWDIGASELTAYVIFIADAMTGSDLMSLRARAALSDVATGVDGCYQSARVMMAEAGLSSDVFSIAFRFYVSDQMTGADVLSILARLSVLDVGAGSDVAYLLTSRLVSDSGSVSSEISSILAKAVLQDSLMGSDATLIKARATRLDSGAGVDVASVVGRIFDTDTATAAELVSLLIKQEKTITDVGTGVSAIGIYNFLRLTEEVLGVDFSVIKSYIAETDVGAGIDEEQLRYNIMILESCESAEDMEIIISIAPYVERLGFKRAPEAGRKAAPEAGRKAAPEVGRRRAPETSIRKGM